VLIREVNSKVTLTEEFVDVVSLKGRTTGKDMKGVLKDHQLHLKNLTGIPTNGVTSMIGKKLWGPNFNYTTYGNSGRMFKF